MTTCDPPDYKVLAWAPDDSRSATSPERTLSPDEMLSIALALELIGDGPLDTLAPTLRSLRAKIRASLHPMDRPRLDRAASALAAVVALGSAVPGWAHRLVRQLIAALAVSDEMLVRHEALGRRFDTPLEFVAIETDSQRTLCLVGRPMGAAEQVRVFFSDITSIEACIADTGALNTANGPHVKPTTAVKQAANSLAAGRSPS